MSQKKYWWNITKVWDCDIFNDNIDYYNMRAHIILYDFLEACILDLRDYILSIPFRLDTWYEKLIWECIVFICQYIICLCIFLTIFIIICLIFWSFTLTIIINRFGDKLSKKFLNMEKIEKFNKKFSPYSGYVFDWLVRCYNWHVSILKKYTFLLEDSFWYIDPESTWQDLVGITSIVNALKRWWTFINNTRIVTWLKKKIKFWWDKFWNKK